MKRVWIPVSLVTAVALMTCTTAPEMAIRPGAAHAESTLDGDTAAPSVLTEVYGDIDGAVAAYQDGMLLMEEGSTTVGQHLVEDALAGLDDAVARCKQIEGCELDRALRAYQRVLAMQSSVFTTGDVGTPTPDEDAGGDSGEREVATPPRGGRTLNGQDLSELIVLNRYVKDALHDWLTWNRPNLVQTYENYQYLRPQMLPVYEEAGLPEALLFGILAVESNGRVHSYSRVGAAGPLQFMRATGSRYGLGETADGFDERLDPARATMANVAYLNDQFQRLGGSLEKVLAAYNAGENRLKRLHDKHNGKDFWSPEFYYSLPQDTRRYVPEVLAAAWLFLHPEDYSLDWHTPRDLVVDMPLVAELSLSELSIMLGNTDMPNGWFRQLRNLNPQLSHTERLPAGTAIRVPSRVVALYEQHAGNEQLVALARDLRDASESREDDMIPYVIQRGDTLGRIANRHACTSIKELAALNNIAPPRYSLRAGKTIKVPNC